MVKGLNCKTISKKPKLQFKVRVGEHNLDQPEGTEVDINVKQVVLHPKWDIGANKTPNGVQIYSKHDLALVELSSPVNFTSNVKSMCLDNGQRFQAGKKYFLSVN